MAMTFTPLEIQSFFTSMLSSQIGERACICFGT